MKKIRTTLFGARKKAWREPRRIHGYSGNGKGGFKMGRTKRGSYTRAKKR